MNLRAATANDEGILRALWLAPADELYARIAARMGLEP